MNDRNPDSRSALVVAALLVTVTLVGTLGATTTSEAAASTAAVEPVGGSNSVATETQTPTRTPIPGTVASETTSTPTATSASAATDTATPTRTPIPDDTATPTRTLAPFPTETATATPEPDEAATTDTPSTSHDDTATETSLGTDASTTVAGEASETTDSATATSSNGTGAAESPSTVAEESTGGGLPGLLLLLPLAGVVATGVALRRYVNSDRSPPSPGAITGAGAGDDGLIAAVVGGGTAVADEDGDDEMDDQPSTESSDDATRGVRSLMNCPDCGGIVGTDERFCSHCGDRLPAEETESDGVDSARGGSSGTERNGATGAGAIGAGDTGSGVPDQLSLTVRGRTITVADGTVVDDQLRAVLRDSGDGDQTKWVDDRHLQFERNDDGFSLVTRGDNLTRLKGDLLNPDEDAPVEPGDEIEVSGILTISVRAD